jgi:hypothetical protein
LNVRLVLIIHHGNLVGALQFRRGRRSAR